MKPREGLRDFSYANDIVTAAGKIKKYLHGTHRGQFDKNEMLRDAVIRQLGIIGDASANLSPAFKEAHPTIPWKAIVGLRQVVIHKYWNVDTDIIWSTAKNDVRVLSTYLRKVHKKSPTRLDAEINTFLARRPSKRRGSKT